MSADSSATEAESNPIQGIESPTLVYTDRAFALMLQHLRTQQLLALDTESDSLYRYHPRVCLIQITARAADDGDRVADYLVDPLRLRDLSALAPLLATSTTEVILHAAENDILTLQRDFGFTFGRIFDTQLAARILGWRQVGLAAILEDKFGIVSDKRMQRTNWGQRPLTPQQIAYAQTDTHYLPALRKLQIDELQAQGRWEEAQEAFAALSQVALRKREPSVRSFWQMKATREVPRAQTGVLEALWQWREQEAQRQDRPPFKILSEPVLTTLAVEQPADRRALRSIHGLSEQQVQRHGSALLQAIAEGRKRPLPPEPEPTLRPEQLLDRRTLARYDRLRRWRTQAAEQRGVEPDIVFSNSVLLEIAQRLPQNMAELEQLAEIGPWKAKTYGPDILRLLNPSAE